MEKYSIGIELPEDEMEIFELKEKLTVGSHKDNNVVVENEYISPNHFLFRVRNGVLTVKVKDLKNITTLGPIKLKSGKMYIVDDGDVLTLGEVHLQILTKDSNTTGIGATKMIQMAEITSEEKTEASAIGKDLDKLIQSSETFDDDDDDEDEELEQLKEEVIKTSITEGLTKKLKLFLASKFNKTTEDYEDYEEYGQDNKDDEDKTKKSTAIFKKFLSFFKKKVKEKELELEEQKEEDDFLSSSSENTSHNRTVVRLTLTTRKKNPTVPFTIRFFAYIANFSISYGIYFTFKDLFKSQFQFISSEPITKELLNNPKVVLLWKEVEIMWGHLPEVIQSQLYFFLPIIVLIVVIDSIFSLLLGSNIFMKLVGASSEKNIFIDRLMGFTRSLLGIFHPFFIFDLPILFGKPTIKELITFSTLRIRMPLKFASFIAFIAYPLFIIIGISLPLLPHLTYINKEKIIHSDMNLKTFKIEGESELISSNFFNMQLKIPKENYSFLIKKGSDNPQSPLRIKVYEHSSNAQFSIKKVDLPIEKLIKKVKKSNPLFSLFYPKLSKSVVNYDLATKEISSLFISSLEISKNNILDTVFKNGVFISGIFDINDELFKILNKNETNEIGIGSINSNYFIVCYKNSKTTILTLRKPYVLLTFNETDKNRTFAKQLPEILLSYLTPIKKENKQKVSTSFLTIHDLLVKEKQGRTQSRIFDSFSKEANNYLLPEKHRFFYYDDLLKMYNYLEQTSILTKKQTLKFKKPLQKKIDEKVQREREIEIKKLEKLKKEEIEKDRQKLQELQELQEQSENN